MIKRIFDRFIITYPISPFFLFFSISLPNWDVKTKELGILEQERRGFMVSYAFINIARAGAASIPMSANGKQTIK